jgi:hypothetical protein
MYEQAAALLDYGFGLASPRPAGQLTDAAPARPDGAEATAAPEAAGPSPSSGATTTSWGLPVLIVAIVAAAGGLLALRASRR